MAFPTSPPSNTDPTAINKLSSPSHSALHQSHNAEIVAVETKVGTGASTPSAGKVLRSVGTGTSAWGQTVIATDVATATSSDLRGILSDETGTGVAVFGTSPSIATPNISTSINDANGNEVIKTPATASATNEITVTNAINGSPPTITATGSSDTNVDLKLSGKGTGKAYLDSISEYTLDFIVSGLVWSGDSYGASLAGSMTAGFAYISGLRVTIAAISAHTFTASKDTYVDLSSAGTITYTEVTNNAASPALSANNIRIAIIVTGASNIAASGSVNQGQENKVLPIASAIPYTVTDSLGNLICPRDPNRKTLGYRQIIVSFSTSNTTATQISGLSCPVIVPTGRKVKVTVFTSDAYPSSGAGTFGPKLTAWEGTVGSGTLLNTAFSRNISSSQQIISSLNLTAITTPASSSKTYNAGLHASAAGTVLINDTESGAIAYIMVELQ